MDDHGPFAFDRCLRPCLSKLDQDQSLSFGFGLLGKPQRLFGVLPEAGGVRD